MKLTITVSNIENVPAVEVKNVCQMWKEVTRLYAELGDEANLIVTDENGKAFKNFTVRRTKSGKRWVMNSVAETTRTAMAKAKAATTAEKTEPVQELHEIEEGEVKPEKKVKKGKKKGAIIAA